MVFEIYYEYCKWALTLEKNSKRFIIFGVNYFHG